jgi:nicotinate-nucleotide adenylyltransferase
MKKIVILGGTFDPIHLGHLHIYRAIKKQIPFDKFLIVPTKKPPLKTHQVYANAQDRLAMIKLMFKNHRDVEIEDYELTRKDNGISYTVNTIKYLSKKYPNAHLYFVVGLDRYLDFKQ